MTKTLVLWITGLALDASTPAQPGQRAQLHSRASNAETSNKNSGPLGRGFAFRGGPGPSVSLSWSASPEKGSELVRGQRSKTWQAPPRAPPAHAPPPASSSGAARELEPVFEALCEELWVGVGFPSRQTQHVGPLAPNSCEHAEGDGQNRPIPHAQLGPT